MTNETPKADYLSVKDDKGVVLFRITDEGIYVKDDLEVDDLTNGLLQKLGGYVIAGVRQSVEGEITRMRATCWQLLEERNDLAAQLQQMQQPQRLDG